VNEGGKEKLFGGRGVVASLFLDLFFSSARRERAREPRQIEKKNDDDDQLIISSLNSIMTVFLLETEKKGRAVEDECV